MCGRTLLTLRAQLSPQLDDLPSSMSRFNEGYVVIGSRIPQFVGMCSQFGLQCIYSFLNFPRWRSRRGIDGRLGPRQVNAADRSKTHSIEFVHVAVVRVVVRHFGGKEFLASFKKKGSKVSKCWVGCGRLWRTNILCMKTMEYLCIYRQGPNMGKRKGEFIEQRFETSKPSFLKNGHLIVQVQAHGQRTDRSVGESKAVKCRSKIQ